MENQAKKSLFSLNVITFFYALHYAVTLYIESSFLSSFVDQSTVGLIFTTAAIGSIFAHFFFANVIRKTGNYAIFLSLSIMEIASLVILASNPSLEAALIVFVLHQILLNLIFLSLNIFVEAYSRNETTGGTRGIFLTVLNTAILFGPLSASFLIKNGNFGLIFLWSSMLMVPVFLISALLLKRFVDPDYDKFSFARNLREVFSRREIRGIFSAQFLLEFFFGIMVIYMPIYLSTTRGMSFSEILGIIMPIALLPFIIFPYILGSIADKKLGEKEMLSAGFIVVGLSTLYLPFLSSNNVLLWAGALFLTRIGATFIETMSESYFYKQIDATDTHFIGFFRNIRALAYIVAPAVASIFLIIFDFKYLFIALGLFMLLGVRIASGLKDTR